MNKKENRSEVNERKEDSAYWDWSHEDMTEEQLEEYIEARRMEFRHEWEMYISQYE